jgi:dienelactone hydrolase
MRANSDKLGIDPEKIAVSGNSAGGHLSLMVAGTPSVVEFEGDGGNPGVPTHVAACIAYYAPAVLYSPEGQLSEFLENLFGKAYAQDTAKQASPIAHASAAFPPTMLVTGNADELVPYEASFTMYRALMDAGAKAELHVYSDAPHAFDAVSEFGRQTANIMALFLDRYVVRPRTLTRATVAAARALPCQLARTTRCSNVSPRVARSLAAVCRITDRWPPKPSSPSAELRQRSDGRSGTLRDSPMRPRRMSRLRRTSGAARSATSAAWPNGPRSSNARSRSNRGKRCSGCGCRVSFRA